MKTKRVFTILFIIILLIAVIFPIGATLAKPSVATAPLLGEAGKYSVLGATAVTNSGDTNMNGAVGVSPGLSTGGGPINDNPIGKYVFWFICIFTGIGFISRGLYKGE